MTKSRPGTWPDSRRRCSRRGRAATPSRPRAPRTLGRRGLLRGRRGPTATCWRARGLGQLQDMVPFLSGQGSGDRGAGTDGRDGAAGEPGDLRLVAGVAARCAGMYAARDAAYSWSGSGPPARAARQAANPAAGRRLAGEVRGQRLAELLGGFVADVEVERRAPRPAVESTTPGREQPRRQPGAVGADRLLRAAACRSPPRARSAASAQPETTSSALRVARARPRVDHADAGRSAALRDHVVRRAGCAPSRRASTASCCTPRCASMVDDARSARLASAAVSSSAGQRSGGATAGQDRRGRGGQALRTVRAGPGRVAGAARCRCRPRTGPGGAGPWVTSTVPLPGGQVHDRPQPVGPGPGPGADEVAARAVPTNTGGTRVPWASGPGWRCRPGPGCGPGRGRRRR